RRTRRKSPCRALAVGMLSLLSPCAPCSSLLIPVGVSSCPAKTDLCSCSCLPDAANAQRSGLRRRRHRLHVVAEHVLVFGAEHADRLLQRLLAHQAAVDPVERVVARRGEQQRAADAAMRELLAVLV